jgi:transposase-like protein
VRIRTCTNCRSSLHVRTDCPKLAAARKAARANPKMCRLCSNNPHRRRKPTCPACNKDFQAERVQRADQHDAWVQHDNRRIA